MWPFRRTRLATDIEIIDTIAKLHAAVKQLQDDHLALENKHERLRGRVYATGLHKIESETAAPTSKAEVLREFGFRPGQPAPHR